MRILIDIGHPVSFHLLKNVAKILKSKNHDILFTVLDKDVAATLIIKSGFKFKVLGKHRRSILSKINGLLQYEKKLFEIFKKFHPDLILSNGSIPASHIAFLFGIPHITFEETGNFEQIVLYKYFVSAILTPACLEQRLGKKQIPCNTYPALAYLHPKYFCPNPKVLNEVGIKEQEKFVLLRFVSWSATHDVGHKGITLDNKRRIIEEFSKYAKVFISSETKLPIDLERFSLNIFPEKLHDLIHYATLTYGESSAVASESAVLGTPAIYLDSDGRCFTRDQETKYGAVYNFTESFDDQIRSIEKGIMLLQNENLKEEWRTKRSKILADCIDLTAFMVWFVEEYPQSFKIMKSSPDYQYNFRGNDEIKYF
jgi:predicted glycosyltransferase